MEAFYFLTLAVCLEVANKTDDRALEDDTSNEDHVAIVRLEQKFKLLGGFTMLTTKVSKYILIIKNSPFYDKIYHFVKDTKLLINLFVFILDSWRTNRTGSCTP